jgi:hypothetical protein
MSGTRAFADPRSRVRSYLGRLPCEPEEDAGEAASTPDTNPLLILIISAAGRLSSKNPQKCAARLALPSGGGIRAAPLAAPTAAGGSAVRLRLGMIAGQLLGNLLD